MAHKESHLLEGSGWLRAGVLGANDGLLSTASLVVGVASAQASASHILLTGLAALSAGAFSMAAGEYVSVSSQADAERSDLARERTELATDAESELQELTGLYVQRGLDTDLARQVAEQLTVYDALGAHARDELGITSISTARPIQAALSSAVSFSVGASVPVLVAAAAPTGLVAPFVAVGALAALAALGAMGAYVGGAPLIRSTLRVFLWGCAAMAATAVVGRLVGQWA